MKCSANSHYEACADVCASSCEGLTEIVQCSATCMEGCECDDGYLFNGQTCVKDTQCGCYDHGKTYKVQLNTFVFTKKIILREERDIFEQFKCCHLF